MKYNKKILSLLVFFVSIFSLLIWNYFKQSQIKEYSNRTMGKVIKFKSVGGGARYSISYVYYVDAEKYVGHTGISFFKCDNGKKGCVGNEFTVYYSSKNPEYSRIDLGKYEKYKTTVEFIK